MAIAVKGRGEYVFGDAHILDELTVDGDVVIAGDITFTGSMVVTLSGGANTAITTTVTGSEAYTGWALGFFGSTQLTSTSGVIGSAAGGVFEVNMTSAFKGSTSGIITGAFIGAYCNSTDGELPTAGLWLETIAGTGVSFQATGAASDMPMIALVTSGAGTKSSLAFEFGSEVAAKTVTTTSGGMFYNGTIQMKANGTLIYMPTSTVEGTYTTAYPIVTTCSTTGIAFTGTMDKGIDFSGVTPDFGSQEDAFIAIGTYTSAITIADTGATFIPIQVNLSSTGSTAVAGSQVAAARLRVDSDTNDQGNTALSCLQLRMDLAKNVYAATGINGSMNISDDIALPTASLQGIYFQITGAGAVTCPNSPNVMEIGYHQSVGGSGFSSVAQFDVNATGCSIDNIVYVKNFGGTVTNGILVDGAFTNGIAVTGTVDKGIDFTDATLNQDWDNAFFACGTGNGAAGDQHSVAVTDFYIPIQVNMVSTAGPAAPSEVCAAMLRVDASTADQGNSSVDVLCIRSDIAFNVYAASCINASLNISDDISVPTATVQGIYVQITGDGIITCPNTVNVLEAVYKQTAPGDGVDNVGAFVCNATGCTITNILWVKNYGGTVTNGILVDGAFATGINLASSCTIGMAVGACTTTAIDFGLTVGTLAGDGNAALIRGGYAATGGHTTPSDPIAFVTANQHAMQFYLSSTTGKFTGIEINAYTSDIATNDDSPTCAIEAVGRSLAEGTGTNSIYGIRAEAQALALKYGPRSSYELIAGFFKTGSAIDGVVGGRTICAKLDLGLGIPSGEGDYGLFIRNNSEGLIGAGPTRVASTCQAVHFDGGYANVFSFGEVMNVNYGDAWSLTGSGGEGHIRCQMWNGAAYVTKYIRLYNA